MSFFPWTFLNFLAYTMITDETAVYVRNVGQTNGIYEHQACGIAFQPDPETAPGKLKVDFHNSPATAGDYWILDTDYENYTAIYSCGSRVPGQIELFKWVLTRSTKPSPEVVNTKYIVGQKI